MSMVFSPSKGPPPQPPTLASERPASLRFGSTATIAGSILYNLTAHRGLQVVSMAGQPGLIGQVPISGEPHTLIVAGSTAFALMGWNTRMVPCPTCPGQADAVDGSLLAAVDVADPAQPRLRGSLPLEGEVLRAQLEGTRLFVVLRHGEGWTPVADGEPSTTLLSIDVTDPAALRQVARLDVPAPAWVDEVRFAPGVVYLARYGRQLWNGQGCEPLASTLPPAGTDGCTRLQAVDLSTLKVTASVDLRGRLLPDASDHRQGVLRALVASSEAVNPGNARFLTFSAGSAAQLAPLGTLAVPAPSSGGQLDVRFAGTRAYVPLHEQENPVLIVDLTRPERPVLGGRLSGVGYVSSILGSTETRLATFGVQADAPPCALPELAIFDVRDPAAPSLLTHRTFDRETSGEASALTEGDDLFLLPFSGRHTPGLIPPRSVRLFDVDLLRGTLNPRGQTQLGGTADYFVRLSDRVLALSSRRAEVLDVRDRDNPAVLGGVELARTVSDFKLAGDRIVLLVQDHIERQFQVALVPLSDPEAPAVSALTFDGRPGPLFTEGPFVYLFWQAETASGTQGRLQVLQVEGGVLRPRAAISLGGPPDVYFGDDPDRDGFDKQVQQVGAGTFLVPLWRVRTCPTVPPVAGSPVPGCGETAPPPPPPPRQVVTPGGPCPGSDADFLVLDATNPDDPQVAARFRLPNEGEILGAIRRDRTFLVTQREKTRRPDDASTRTDLVRHFVTEVQLADPARPVVGAPVNVPGPLVTERASEGAWITVEPKFAERSPPTGVAVNLLLRDAQSGKAFLQRQLELPGEVSGPVGDGDTLFFTVDGQLVAVDVRGAEAPRIRSRTPIPGATTSYERGPLRNGFFNSKPGVPANVHRALGGQVFVLLRHRVMLVYDARDPDRPRLRDGFVISSDRAPVRELPGNRAIVARDQVGVAVVDLPPP